MYSEVNGSFFWALSLFCVLTSFLGSLYAVVASFCIGRFVQRRLPPTSQGTAGVSVLKPLYGAEPGLFAALASFCDQDYPGPLHIIFGVQSPDDPAIGIVRELAKAYPQRHIELVIEAAEHGTNRKVSNLINMSSRIRHEIVCLADSDIVVAPDHVSRVVTALGDAGVGMVTCMYSGEPIAGIWSRLSAAGVNLHFLPSILVGIATGLARPCFGSTMALRRQTLAAIGGFRPFASQLADDYTMGEAVRGLGLEVAIPPIIVAHLCHEESWTALWRHELRWARTIRLINPLGFLGAGVSHALPLAVIGVMISGFQRYALAALAAAVAARMLLSWNVRRLLPGAGSASLDSPLLLLRDMVSFAVFAASFLTLRVHWRDLDYEVALAGTMVPLKEDVEP